MNKQLSGCWINSEGTYYEGDRLDEKDILVEQRQTDKQAWDTEEKKWNERITPLTEYVDAFLLGDSPQLTALKLDVLKEILKVREEEFQALLKQKVEAYLGR